MPYEYKYIPEEDKKFLAEREKADLKTRIREGLDAIGKIPHDEGSTAYYVRNELIELSKKLDGQEAVSQSLLLDSIANSAVILDGFAKRIEKKAKENKDTYKEFSAMMTEIFNLSRYLKELEEESEFQGELKKGWIAKLENDKRRTIRDRASL